MEEKSPSLEALRKVIEAADTSRVTKDDFIALAKQIIQIVKADKSKSDEKRAELAQQVQSSLTALESRINADLSDLRASIQSLVESSINKLNFDHDSMMAEIKARVDMIEDGADGKDGKDADEAAIIAKVIAQIKLPETQIIDVEKLKKEIIEAMPKPRMGAIGASVIHKFMDDETPSGTKNGVNTTFTLIKAPVNGSLKLYRGGARQRVTEDYTLSGRTITFTIAPASAEILLADYRYF